MIFLAVLVYLCFVLFGLQFKNQSHFHSLELHIEELEKNQRECVYCNNLDNHTHAIFI